MDQSSVLGKINVSIPEDAYWIGLSKQNMDFHQVLGELIDNSISASGVDEEGDLKPFKIEVLIQRIGDKIRLKVADEGTGISLSDLLSKVLAPGGRGSNLGPLNEHGFGLKNALCVLTGNRLPWKIQTRDQDAVDKGLYYLVKGPFRRDMQVVKDDPSNWNTNLVHVRGERGTRVYAETNYYLFNTLYRRAREFSSLIKRLMEHLGVMYRGFLENTANKLWLRWQDQGNDVENPNTSASWQEERVRPIEIPYDVSGSKRIPIEISHNGVKTTVIYEFGLLDRQITDDSSLGPAYPLRIYYRGNIPTQGIDIRVRGRVIRMSLLPEIWPDIPRHNDFNKFVGELILDENFETVNNKTGIDPHNPFWEKLMEIMNAPDFPHKPQRITRIQTEKNIKEKLKIHLEGFVTGSSVTLDYPVWSGTGVKIDILHEKPNGEIDIYEVKAGTAAPIDVYQLVMYWDGLVNDGKNPSLGRLVAKSIPNSVKNIIDSLNKRKDANGNTYHFEGKTITELGISV